MEGVETKNKGGVMYGEIDSSWKFWPSDSDEQEEPEPEPEPEASTGKRGSSGKAFGLRTSSRSSHLRLDSPDSKWKLASNYFGVNRHNNIMGNDHLSVFHGEVSTQATLLPLRQCL